MVLAVACGGRSISRVEDDGEDGGTSGTTASTGGGANHDAAATGGTTLRGVGGAASSPATSKGGTGSGTALPHDGGSSGGGPSEGELDDYCINICKLEREPSCGAIDYGTCIDDCDAYVALSMHTVECARTLYLYFDCITELPDICALHQEDRCARNSAASLDCVAYYCRTHDEDEKCRRFGY